MTKPVYIINGFLESGKTEFITFTLGQPYFQIKGRTLLILCEEGENEYDPALLKKSRTDVVLIEEEEEFNPNHLIELVLESGTADHDHRRLHLPHVLYQHEVSVGRDDP